MAEGQILFRLGYEQFMGNWGQNILSFLQEEFDTRNNPLSRSLLFSEETEGTYTQLTEFVLFSNLSVRFPNRTDRLESR